MRHSVKVIFTGLILICVSAAAQESGNEEKAAFRIAKLFYAARAAVGERASFTDDPTSNKVHKSALLDTIKLSYDRLAGEPLDVGSDVRMTKMWNAINTVIDKAMSGEFKGRWSDHPNFPGKLIPARFGSELVKEFNSLNAGAIIRWTTSNELLVNAANKADEWEQGAIKNKFKDPKWKQGTPYFETVGGDFRYALPEYFKTACMNCHGGEMGKIIHKGKGAAGSGSFGGILSVSLKK